MKIAAVLAVPSLFRSAKESNVFVCYTDGCEPLWRFASIRAQGKITGGQMRPILAITEIRLTDEEGWLIRFGEVVDVGEAQRYDRGFSDPTQSVPQEHVDPHVGTRLPGAGFMKTEWPSF